MDARSSVRRERLPACCGRLADRKAAGLIFRPENVHRAPRIRVSCQGKCALVVPALMPLLDRHAEHTHLLQIDI